MTLAVESHQDASSRFAAGWARAVTGTSFTFLEYDELERFLRELTDQIAPAVGGPDTAGWRDVGVRLVDQHFTNPRTLERTVEYLTTRYTEHFDELGGNALGTLVGALVAGYTAALRDRSLREQERMLRAGLTVGRRAVRALRDSEARFRAVFEDSAIGIGICDMSGRILTINQALADMFGISIEDFVKHDTNDFLHPDDSPEYLPAFAAMLKGERDSLRMDKPYLRADGKSIMTKIVVSLIRDDDGKPLYILGLMEDITERERFARELKHQANHDQLTGLPNRRFFLDHLQELVETARPDTRVGLCHVGLDRFKSINDTIGHDMGDQLLIAVADRLRLLLDDERWTVTRLAGDEFAVIVEDPRDEQEVAAIAERVLESLRDPVEIDELQLPVSATIGVVEHRLADVKAGDLIRDADLTLLWAKSRERGRWARCDTERNTRQIAKYRLSQLMPKALERGEFFLEYQPLIRLADGSWHGAEALVRWQHPDFGRIPPDDFISLAEETDFIVPLGQWILEEACRQGKRWYERLGPSSPLMSVNVAVPQLRAASRGTGIAELVEATLSETGLPASKLQLEVTESAIMGPSDFDSLETLNRLAAMGVGLAIDDFGTGYSNLSYLHRLPASNLKLAGSFIDNLRSPDHPSPTDGRLVVTLIALAQTFNMSVTAEAIETREQAARLLAFGCDIGQGYFFSRPVAAEKLEGYRSPFPYESGSDGWPA